MSESIQVSECRLAEIDGEYYVHGYSFPVLFRGTIVVPIGAEYSGSRRLESLMDRNHVRYLAYRQPDGYYVIVPEEE